MKVVPDNSVAVKRNTVAIQWLVDYLWISYRSNDFSSLWYCNECLKKKEKKKKKKKKKKKRRKKRKKKKKHFYYFSETIVVGSILHLHRVELNRLKVNYIVRSYFILLHVFR